VAKVGRWAPRRWNDPADLDRTTGQRDAAPGKPVTVAFLLADEQ
jgi:hypothetical protein